MSAFDPTPDDTAIWPWLIFAAVLVLLGWAIGHTLAVVWTEHNYHALQCANCLTQ